MGSERSERDTINGVQIRADVICLLAASEMSETLSGLNNGNRRYIYVNIYSSETSL